MDRIAIHDSGRHDTRTPINEMHFLLITPAEIANVELAIRAVEILILINAVYE